MKTDKSTPPNTLCYTEVEKAVAERAATWDSKEIRSAFNLCVDTTTYACVISADMPPEESRKITRTYQMQITAICGYCETCNTAVIRLYERPDSRVKDGLAMIKIVDSHIARDRNPRALCWKKCPRCSGKLFHSADEGEIRGWTATKFLNAEEEIAHRKDVVASEGLKRIIRDKKLRYNHENVAVIAEKQLQEYRDTVDLPMADAVSQETTHNITADTEKLKEYILQLIKLENNIYALSWRLGGLYYSRVLNKKAAEWAAYHNSDTAYDAVEQLRISTDELKVAYQNSQAEVEKRQSEAVRLKAGTRPTKPNPPKLEKPGLFNKKKIEKQNSELEANYHAAMISYKEALLAFQENTVRRKEDAEKKKQQRIAEAARASEEVRVKLEEAQAKLATAKEDFAVKQKELMQIPTAESKVDEILKGEIAQIKKLLKKAYEARNKLYAVGVIFPKYRNVTALTSFYEYLMAGRCTKLEGMDGAYNLYESEVRANRVIERLDTVIDSLERIKANQYMMYSAMCSIKGELKQLNDTMNSALTAIYSIENSASDAVIQLEGISQIGSTIAKNSEVIAYNTAATAYYAKKNAELTDALGYLAALK